MLKCVHKVFKMGIDMFKQVKNTRKNTFLSGKYRHGFLGIEKKKKNDDCFFL